MEFKYAEKENGIELTNVLSFDKKVYETLVIPEEIDGHTVVGIGNQLFSQRYIIIKKLILPKYLTYINDFAFSLCGIKEIIFNEKLEIIGGGAFSSNEIKTLKLPEGLSVIYESAFSHNSIEELIIPNSVKDIKNNAFAYNDINTLTIGTGISTLSRYCFGFNNIVNLTIPGNVKEVENYAFVNSELKTIVLEYGVENVHPDAFYTTTTNNETSFLRIPSSMKSIRKAFVNRNIHSVLIDPSDNPLYYFQINNFVRKVYLFRVLKNHLSEKVLPKAEYIYTDVPSVIKLLTNQTSQEVEQISNYRKMSYDESLNMIEIDSLFN